MIQEQNVTLKIDGSIFMFLQKRRERINERLRILQNLVPNGTKVSSMGSSANNINLGVSEAEIFRKKYNKIGSFKMAG